MSLILGGFLKALHEEFDTPNTPRTKALKPIDKYYIWEYNKRAKLIKYCKVGIIFFLGKVCPFSSRKSLNLIKCKFRLLREVIPILQLISLATIGVCFFVRLTSVAALFIIAQKIIFLGGKENDKFGIQCF